MYDSRAVKTAISAKTGRGAFLFCLYSCCSILLFVPAVVLACMVTTELSGTQYYTRGEESFGPACRVIIHPITREGAEIEFGIFGGGTIVDMNLTYVSPAVEIERVHGQVEVDLDLAKAPTLRSDECTLLFAAGLILDGATGEQVPMPSACGGATPGVWQDGGSGWSGIWAMPLVLGAVGWGMMRLIILATRSMNLEEEDRCGKHIFLYTIKCSAAFLFLPISNMEVSAACPQILISYYSGFTTVVLNTLFVACSCLLCCGMVLASIAGVCDVADDLAGMVFCVFYLCWLVPVMVFYGFLISDTSFSWLFAIHFNFAFRWPEFSLSTELLAFHILMLVIWLLDTCEFFFKLLSGLKYVRARSYKVAGPFFPAVLPAMASDPGAATAAVPETVPCPTTIPSSTE